MRTLRGGISEGYRHSIGLTRRSLTLPFGHIRTLLRGWQLHGYPTTSLRSRRYMEVPRHVLAQMVVAGTHMVPFGSGVPYFGVGSDPAAAMGPRLHPGAGVQQGFPTGAQPPSAFHAAPGPQHVTRPAESLQHTLERQPRPPFPPVANPAPPQEDLMDPLGWLVDLMNPGK